MTGGPQDLTELAAAYCLGALDPAEAKAFEAFMATSPEAVREVAAYREVAALLAVGAAGAGTAPRPDLRARVLARATAQPSPAPLRLARPPRALWLALAASLVGLLGTTAAWLTARSALAAREEALVRLEDTLAAREARLAQREATLNAILEPGVSLTRLTTSGDDQPVVQLFWNHSTNVSIVHVFNLRPATERRVFQLWFIPKDGAPIPSVTFNTEPSGHSLVERIPVPEGLDLVAAAITNEPEGGSLQPTTTPIVVGSFVRART